MYRRVAEKITRDEKVERVGRGGRQTVEPFEACTSETRLVRWLFELARVCRKQATYLTHLQPECNLTRPTERLIEILIEGDWACVRCVYVSLRQDECTRCNPDKPVQCALGEAGASKSSGDRRWRAVGAAIPMEPSTNARSCSHSAGLSVRLLGAAQRCLSFQCGDNLGGTLAQQVLQVAGK